MKRPKGLPLVCRLGNYARAKLGYGGKQKTSLYRLVCESLALDGKPRPIGKTEKQWVEENLDFILGQKGKGRVRKTTKPMPPVVSFQSTDAFLSTYEWRKVRMQALKKHGARCQCCGASPATGAVMNVDHIKPRKLFPQLALDVDNLQILCHECNHGKGNWDMTDWRPDTEYAENVENYFIDLPNV